MTSFMITSPEVLAIDGGGTRCRLACVSPDNRWMVETGSANASTDLSGAVEEIQEGLRRLADRMAVEVDSLKHVPAYIGLAGVVSDDIAKAVANHLPLARTRVADDRPSAVRGALGRDDGAAAHCGTGSFLGIQKNGRIRLSGGWGAVLGDQASAQWIARKALLATLDVADNLRPASELSEQLLARVGSTADIVSFAARATPSQFGELAPLVSGAATKGDPIAREALADGASYISQTLRKMGWTTSLPLCLTGGMGKVYEDYLPEDMREALVQPLGDPIEGALSLARDFRTDLKI
jgi:glucosamine kinase